MRVASLGLEAQGFELLLERGDLADGAALLLPAGAQAGGLLLHLGEFALDVVQALLGVARPSRAAARCASISSEVARRSRSSISTGTLPIWMASAAAASSTRSMALSGRKRSLM